MLRNIISAKCVGIQAVPVNVEVNISSGLGIHLVGLADAAVKESLLRTVTALQSMGFRIPGKKIVINLAPADMHKKGSGYDLPIALGIIASSEQDGPSWIWQDPWGWAAFCQQVRPWRHWSMTVVTYTE